MSKTTNIVKPIFIGGLMLAAGILAAASLRKRNRASDTVDTIVETCEHALSKLLERTGVIAA